MSNSSNDFKNMKPIMKDKYSSKLKRITEKPNNSSEYFKYINKTIKKLNK